MIGGVVNAVVDTGVRLLTGQEVSLKTIGSSFVEGCVASAVGLGSEKVASKVTSAVGKYAINKAGGAAARTTIGIMRGDSAKDIAKSVGIGFLADNILDGASATFSKIRARRANAKTTSTKQNVNTNAVKTRNIKIKGYTKHGINQAISHDGKGVKPSSILHAVKYGKAKIQKNGTVRYTSEQASVVLNELQRVVSAWAKSSKYWR